MKNTKKKNKTITNDALARMIKNGFDDTPTKAQFEILENKVDGIDVRLQRVEKKLDNVEKKLNDFTEEYHSEKLPMRMEYVENVLNLPKK